MTANALFFAAFGAVYGGLAGWWWRGRRERRVAGHEVLAVLEGAARAAGRDPESWRRDRLAYDRIYDERHPEEWA